MIPFLRRFYANECGAAAIEYALIAAFVSILIVAGVSAIGTKLSATYYGPVSGNLT